MTPPPELLPFLSVMGTLVVIISGVIGIVVKLQEAQSRKLEQCYKDAERLQEDVTRLREELRRALIEVEDAHKARRMALADAQYWQTEATNQARGGSVRRPNRTEAAQDRDVERDRVERDRRSRNELDHGEKERNDGDR